MVGAVNAERIRRGDAPLNISNTLNLAADAIVELHVRRGGIPLDHYAECSPSTRAEWFSWPGFQGISENLTYGSNARASFDGWMDSTGHRNNMLRPTARFIGIANIGTYWAMTLSEGANAIDPAAGVCQPGDPATARCELTGDFGDASLLPAATLGFGDDSSENGSSKKRSGLKLLALKRRGRQFALTYTVKKGVRGSVGVTIKRCKAKRRRCTKTVKPKVKRSVRGSKRTMRFRVRRGHYALRLSFKGRAGWASARSGRKYATVPR